ncbi:glycoside hydrolase family 3 protein [Phycicoccus sonneratiae]|uniref:Glycoside hydrolase family 3 protein n=1 Tax=Phycicoccus sonneratiae TaxID=2807628 RepID=A0ABS2CJH1_9MICO|nr:glycoside hydrolase family 3 N-terminal domain-containing protein [Phycicoccus sonneraticus]MBM6400021.1 glycoside hydrolase family 3 protein [Phycicoccus sonneraticus]
MSGAELDRLARRCLLPGFSGHRLPDWVRRELALGLGGVVLYHGNVADLDQVARLVEEVRREREDAVVAIDEEGGDVTRLELSTGSSWPGNAALGAVDDVGLTREVARQIGLSLRQVGLRMTFAPTVDVNEHRGNPVIGVRAFGADPAVVARHSVAFVEGLQGTGVAACAKHFPGHGAVDVDSHLALPVLDTDAASLEASALPPFVATIGAGVRSVMVGHLALPALGVELASTSELVMRTLLRQRLGFEGVVVTDALEMGGFADTVGLVAGGVRAVGAGADLLCIGALDGEDRTCALRSALVAAVRDGSLPEERLHDVGARLADLHAWSAQEPVGPLAGPDRDVGLVAARRAVQVSGPPPVLGDRVVVVEAGGPPNPAVGDATWGIGGLLADRRRGVEVRKIEAPASAEAVLAPAAGADLVLVVRDRSVHPWLGELTRAVLAHRPDAVVVDVGAADRPAGARHYLATHGASAAAARVVTELLDSGRVAAVAAEV